MEEYSDSDPSQVLYQQAKVFPANNVKGLTVLKLNGRLALIYGYKTRLCSLFDYQQMKVIQEKVEMSLVDEIISYISISHSYKDTSIILVAQELINPPGSYTFQYITYAISCTNDNKVELKQIFGKKVNGIFNQPNSNEFYLWEQCFIYKFDMNNLEKPKTYKITLGERVFIRGFVNAKQWLIARLDYYSSEVYFELVKFAFKKDQCELRIIKIYKNLPNHSIIKRGFGIIQNSLKYQMNFKKDAFQLIEKEISEQWTQDEITLLRHSSTIVAQSQDHFTLLNFENLETTPQKDIINVEHIIDLNLQLMEYIPQFLAFVKRDQNIHFGSGVTPIEYSKNAPVICNKEINTQCGCCRRVQYLVSAKDRLQQHHIIKITFNI